MAILVFSIINETLSVRVSGDRPGNVLGQKSEDEPGFLGIHDYNEHKFGNHHSF